MKKGKEKGGKGKGKGMGRGMGKGMGKGKGKDENIFDHYECSPSPTTVSFGGKGKSGKGSKGKDNIDNNDDNNDNDDSHGVTIPPYPTPIIPPSVPVDLQSPIGLPSGDSGGVIVLPGNDDVGSMDMDFPTILPKSSSDGSNDENKVNNSNDDDSTSTSGRQYSNSGLSFPSNTNNDSNQSITKTRSVGQKVGYSILLLIACLVGIVCGYVVYRQQQQRQEQQQQQPPLRTIQQPILNVGPCKNSWIQRWDSLYHHNNNTTIQQHEQSENERLTSKFRNEI
jgi:hypothetical protein